MVSITCATAIIIVYSSLFSFVVLLIASSYFLFSNRSRPNTYYCTLARKGYMLLSSGSFLYKRICLGVRCLPTTHSIE
jgi:hypothetical protein